MYLWYWINILTEESSQEHVFMLLVVRNEELGFLLCDGAIFVCPCVFKFCSDNTYMYCTTRLNSKKEMTIGKV